MDRQAERNIQFKYSRLAGLSYIIFTLSGLVKNFVLDTRLSNAGAIKATLFENELHFRLGIVAETIMFLGVILASVSFYVVLKPINRQLSLMALYLRSVEIIIGGMAVVFSMVMLTLSVKSNLLDIYSSEQLYEFVILASNFRQPAYEYSWIFMGFAGVLTFYLFLKSRIIPRFWSVWGILTYSSLILYPILKILVPDLPRETMFVLFPGALFELGVGIWLLSFGVKIPIDSVNAHVKR
ncbi:DUF4386 domain-containing protein [Roseivirga sp.]|uniref:DUF4386 domain-containing protein n=1 Tax=Roseivirga sp. TaxID=1964215 RepID=UPI003B8DC4EF